MLVRPSGMVPSYSQYRWLVSTSLVTEIVLLLSILQRACGGGEVIYAINCGGDAHVDIHGVRYERDPLPDDSVGIPSEYGKQLTIQRVVGQDQILYQTERYHDANFQYNVAVTTDGEYVVVLKFSEVYFTAPSMKVFDVRINGIDVITDLDIYKEVGRGVAHDELLEITVSKGKLLVADAEITFNGVLNVEFVKTDRDNPKINAIYVKKGTKEDVPKLPEWPTSSEFETDEEEEEHDDDDDDDDEEEEEEEARPKADSKQKAKKRKPSGPKLADPYATTDTHTMLPIFIAVGCFIPLLFFLCKL
ncbi:PREDICTED: malectin-B-like [Priapulus caudatus]|uniref:Malectin-B-like n=1 Tax=Priapulus caudatus TaxID=37621 RepID=A0ABM1EPZ6_PRICU|nr:PREDICTED: malectin-B-like [Priapulus caudatus]